MKSLINFINESQGDSKSAIDEIMSNIKSYKTIRFGKVAYCVDDVLNIWGPITYTILPKEKSVIFSFCSEKKQPILDELGELINRKPKYNADEDFASFKIEGEDVEERCQKLLDWISKNIKKVNFLDDQYITMDVSSAEKYRASKTAFNKKSFEDQMKELDEQIKALQDQKTKLQDLQNFIKDLEKE